MALLRRRRAQPDAAPPQVATAPVPPAHIQRMPPIDDPDMGSIKRRFLRRRLAGIVTRGPSAPPTPAPPPEPVVLASASDAYAALVTGAIRDLDEHARTIGQMLDTGRARDREEQVLVAEKRDLQRIRRGMVADLAQPPVLDAHRLRCLLVRARELRALYWAAAERYARAGDVAEAGAKRVEALSAYRLAEREFGVRHQAMVLGG